MDVDSIPPGVDFVLQLQEQVDRCDVLVALIGRGWTTPALRNRNNYVRIEIERALDNDIPIVPVLLDDAEMPPAAEVPYRLDGLLTRQALRVRRDSYSVDLQRLVHALQAVPRRRRPVISAGRWLNWPAAPRHSTAIETAFIERVHRDVLDAIVRDPEHLGVMSPQRRSLTVWFSDIAGFTGASESLTNTLEFLTDLMTPITDVILRRRGTVDKYIGDSVLAFWNAPLEDRTPEANACAAALDLNDAMIRINEEFTHRSIPNVRLQVGIVTGPCVVGPAGSRRRFEYSCVGDTVNLASRLAASTKEAGFPLLLDETTAQAARTHFAVLEIDPMVVKGLTRKIHRYALIGDDSVRASPSFQAAAEQYAVARAASDSGDRQAATAAFRAAADLAGDYQEVRALCQSASSQLESRQPPAV
jgi:class 3 adenylate cyclase